MTGQQCMTPANSGCCSTGNRRICEKCGTFAENDKEHPCVTSPNQDLMIGFIRRVCAEMADFLVKKNISYGNSVAEPVRIFSNVDPIGQINVRIDDKLSRMMRGRFYHDDDDEKDLIGYLILKRATDRYLQVEGKSFSDVMDSGEITKPDWE